MISRAPRLTLFKSLFILIFLFTSATASSAEIVPYKNSKTPGFSLPDLRGKIHNLLDYRGKVILINFWASWCLPCIREMPELQRLKEHFANRPFEILAINVGESREKVQKFTKTIKLELPVLLDSDSNTFYEWQANALPASFIIDIDGHIRYRARGNPGWENKDTLSIIEDITPE